MFEKLIEGIILQYFGDYIENLDTNKLQVGVSNYIIIRCRIQLLSGSLTLEDILIKASTINEMKFPFKLIHGIFGKLFVRQIIFYYQVQIPWKNNFSSPTTIEIENVEIVLKFLTISEWEFLDFYSYKKKLSYLNTFFTKKINELTEALNKEKQKPLSYLDKIKMKIIDNLHIKFKDIHIRIEDNSNTPFSSLGITLDELLIINTNNNWEESFINRHDNNNENYLYKLLKIHNFGFYLISEESIFVSQKENDDKGIKKEVMKQIK